ncbi:MerR family transcriptional regulator [Galbitalea soli]|uniref:MerR family transcriptional regulator n=1 Tax=Galbitalea soli TaxID=1268042 RepID=A0A7C9PP27_9MICO|nr:MerR family transcriptional regulator [Galbitalea soli]NEM91886.1 MerR family transcriptional regulator [Galbitalea soli]NYJ29278.1 DNA-binding transcriptional MerR regulator [Galbitalea soli]
MRVSELSRRSGVPVGRIKFYLREGLLHGGALAAANQASYDETHVERIRLIQSLIGVGGLSVAAAARVIAAIDSELPLPEVFDIAQRTVTDERGSVGVSEEGLARISEVTAGWCAAPDNPGRLAAARIADSFARVGQTDDRGWFARYAAAALLAAEADLDEIETRPDRNARAETVVVGTVLGDALFAALRRIAQEHVTALRYGGAA